MTRESLLQALGPVLDRAWGLDVEDPAAAVAALRAVPTGEIEAALKEAHAAGWLTPKESGGVRYGRLARADASTRGFSIDVVQMSGAATGAHTHPRGEIDLCFVLEGAPRFDGREPGWVVYPPGSRHVPTVTGGRMLIVYLLPDGAIQFEPGR